MTIFMITAGFIGMGLLIGLYATANAPVGYEDAAGFHFGDERGQVCQPESLSQLAEDEGLAAHHA